MTTYHVWLPGQDEPEVVESDDVGIVEGQLWFWTNHLPTVSWPRAERIVRRLRPNEWHRWAVVHDDADHII